MNSGVFLSCKFVPVELSVIIVNYNVVFYLEQCLHSVIRALHGINSEIIVVDNASTDSSKEYLPTKFPTVSFLWLPQNIGYAKANNIGIQQANGRYILLLNPDTILAEDSIALSLQFLQQNPKAGALGIRMVDGSGKFLPESKRGFPSPISSLFKLSGFTHLFPKSKKVSGYYAGHVSHDATGPIDVVAGAYMMCAKKILEEVGGLDEKFFMYGEDIDLSYRIHLAGYQNYYFADSTILHFKGESTLKNTDYVNRFYNAMIIYIDKHYDTFWKRLPMKLGIYLGRCVSYIKTLFTSTKVSLSAMDKNTAIVTSQSYLTTLVKILQHSSPSLLIHGRLTVSAEDQQYAIGHIDEIPQLTEKGIRNYILSSDALSYKRMIDIIQHYPQVYYFFHAAGSSSIVGSMDKNKQGLVIHQ